MSSSPSPVEITRLLLAWNRGEKAAFDELAPLVLEELRRLARVHLRRESQSSPYQTNDLVNEAFVRLVDCARVQWQDRAHFFAMSAQLMRRVLVDLARARNVARRGGGNAVHVTFDEAVAISPDRGGPDWIVVDQALENLAALDARKARVVEMRFFAGLTAEEAAEVLQVSVETVNRDWRFSKTWLRRHLYGQESA